MIDRSQLTPMMQQYLSIKDENPDALLFFRLGDFYEMFFDDAITASKVLNITLTTRDAGLENRIPMCGVPYHVVDQYLPKLLSAGYKVAICEQTEDPAKAKGLVKREVIEILTPGTYTHYEQSDHRNNNFIISIYYHPLGAGLAFADYGTGDFFATEWQVSLDMDQQILQEILRVQPKELIFNQSFKQYSNALSMLGPDHGLLLNERNMPETMDDHVMSLLETTWDDIPHRTWSVKPYASMALVGLLHYLEETKKTAIHHVKPVQFYDATGYMTLDHHAFSTLELIKTMYYGQKTGSLYDVMDQTKTSMGSRLLRQWMERPLYDCHRIENRLDHVEAFVTSTIVREEVRRHLGQVYDIDRLVMRLATGRSTPKDLNALKNSLEALTPIKHELIHSDSKGLQLLGEKLSLHQDIIDHIQMAIVDDPPITLKDGGVIREGFSAELDELRKLALSGREYLANYEGSLKEQSGIRNLKIKYNKILGYYIEVTKSQVSLVPDHFIRKQTLVGSERYFTEKLKELEDEILHAGQKALICEQQCYEQVIQVCYDAIANLQQTAASLAYLDVIAALAHLAYEHQYVRPHMTDDTVIHITDGRHPVVEQLVREESFIPNDILIDNKAFLHIITGPNMAGKSTYMRQVAIIVIMAQMGSFVPATEATIGLVDRIFTRIGASDNLSRGESTFMVEMKEVATILQSATPRSLVILDEVGRGTSTYDGLSIAWAVVEYMEKYLKSRTLFATHYHELTRLEERLEGVKNYNILVTGEGDHITFLRKLAPGCANRSYGIEVAKLAGIHQEVIDRAGDILSHLTEEATELLPSDQDHKMTTQQVSTSQNLSSKLMTSQKIAEKLEQVVVDNMTPMEALLFVQSLQIMLKKSGDSHESH